MPWAGASVCGGLLQVEEDGTRLDCGDLPGVRKEDGLRLDDKADARI